MPNKTFSVAQYQLQTGFKNSATWGGVQILIQGYVVCFGPNRERLIVYGLHPDSPVPPAPVCNWGGNVGAIFVPFTELHPYVDIVRNEMPVYARLDSDHPEWMGLRTSMEPVGEEES
jgi:hypothetical protein